MQFVNQNQFPPQFAAQIGQNAPQGSMSNIRELSASEQYVYSHCGCMRSAARVGGGAIQCARQNECGSTAAAKRAAIDAIGNIYLEVNRIGSANLEANRFGYIPPSTSSATDHLYAELKREIAALKAGAK